MLKSRRNSYTPKTDRYNEEAFHHPGGNSKQQNVLPVKAAKAIAFNPKQRIVIEVAYKALKNAGMSLRKVAGMQTACYIGTSIKAYGPGTQASDPTKARAIYRTISTQGLKSNLARNKL
ncbi:hypothetical protein LZ30DRAFT_692222 [Colletotrichum cereale]|nr:hypothetical protein LZ30DRAFT_692222 [Colletotrichum cereale]